jgi:hypothetical protein
MLCEPLLIDEILAADALSLRTGQLRKMVSRGQLPCRVLPSGERRFDPAELREWVSRLRHAEPVPA